MPTNPLAANDDLVAGLQHGVRRGEWGLHEVPAAVKLVVEHGCWRERLVQQTGEIVQFESFGQFVTTPLVEGLGTDVDTLKRLCRDDPEALDALDQVTVGPQGAHHHHHNITMTEQGTGRQYALRKLRKERADLHKRVLAGDLTPHAAMIEAGFRQRTITVSPTAEGFAAAARKHLTPAQLVALREALA